MLHIADDADRGERVADGLALLLDPGFTDRAVWWVGTDALCVQAGEGLRTRRHWSDAVWLRGEARAVDLAPTLADLLQSSTRQREALRVHGANKEVTQNLLPAFRAGAMPPLQRGCPGEG